MCSKSVSSSNYFRGSSALALKTRHLCLSFCGKQTVLFIYYFIKMQYIKRNYYSIESSCLVAFCVSLNHHSTQVMSM